MVKGKFVIDKTDTERKIKMRKRDLRIGNVQLENPFLLAPLAGITDAPTRKICREMGAALVYSEMVSGKGLYYKDKKTDQLLHIDEDEKPVKPIIKPKETQTNTLTSRKVEKTNDEV